MVSLTVHPEKCSGCRICEMACSGAHLGVFNPRKALLRIEIDRSPRIETELSRIDVPVVCLQCDPAPCAEACPVEAIVKAETGAWVVDKERCTGCGLCVDACTQGMISVDSGQRIAIKCDLCQGSPTCVSYCPMEALVFS
jgi:carbon-monoxide dehydrogenase iron sulfur subunit